MFMVLFVILYKNACKMSDISCCNVVSYGVLNFTAQSLVYFVIAFFIINFGFTMIEALLNPFLGDNFGFNIEYISYVFCFVVVLFFTANATL